MPSSYTTNLGVEKPADGEQDGIWGDIVNDNMDILDRAVNGGVTLSLAGTASTLSTSDGTLSDGQNKFLILGGTPSGTHTITITPNDAEKVYYVYNLSGQSVIFTQGSGTNVTIATNDSAVIYADGGGSGAGVVNITDHFAMNSVKITGGTITGVTDIAVADGGTGASTAAAARTNLGVVIGTDVQAYDAALQSISGLITSANQTIYTTALDTYATTTLTAYARSLLDDPDAATARSTLSLGTMSTQNATSVSITGGSITGITDLAVADGGTGASTAADARTNLGVAIGSNVQAYDAGLQSISGLITSADQMLYTTASDTYATTALSAYGRTLIDDADAATARGTLGLGTMATQSSASVSVTGGSISGVAITGITDLAIADGGTGASDAGTARTNLGLGTIATQDSAFVSITGGSITGITDLAIADGGTGASDAATARSNLGLAIGSNVQAYDADLAALAAIATNGVLARTGAGTAAARTITGTANQITVTNGDGAAGNPTIAAVIASQAQAQAGTDSTTLMTPLRTAQAIAALSPASSQTFTASGTWTKPAGLPSNALIYVRVWGGGGGGGKDADYAGGGGGGGYKDGWFSASSLGATETVTVGAGGASGGGAGGTGGTSSFGSLLTAYGGGGGGWASSAQANGGGGGGSASAGGVGTNTAGGTPGAGGGGRGGILSSVTAAQNGAGGGGGGYGQSAGVGGSGGEAIFGGGGGGGSSSGSNAASTPGTSIFGGNGGRGGNGTNTPQDGVAPGGGGGGTEGAPAAGAGARGEVRIYIFG